MKKKPAIVFTITFIGIVVSCQKMLPPAPRKEELLAGTIPGLTSDQEHQHLTGDNNFARIFSKADGLGPVYLQTSCSNCHVTNGKGPPSTVLTRFAKVNGMLIDYLLDKGGPQ